MKRCASCRTPAGQMHHPTSESCHWLDATMACPHCGGALTWFRGAPLGDLMDEMSMEPEP